VGKVFRERLTREFAARKQANPRYSLRAFAAFLGTDHSTLSKVMRGSRRATAAQVRGIDRKLGMSPEEITVHLAAEHVPNASTAQRHAQLRHWTAEALALVSGSLDWQIVQMCRVPGFRPDSRRIAAAADASVDEVNVALARLLRLGLIDGRWRAGTALAALPETEFRKLALARIRQKAAEDQVTFGQTKG
jgi:transcriptional regulator with XRE-family HTH domain